MQHVLHQGPEEEREFLISSILDKFCNLATDKCGSHVIERAFKEVGLEFAS